MLLLLVYEGMKVIEKDKIVELKYTLREGGARGEVMEVMDEHWPLKFYFGSGQMLAGFEANLLGLAEGSSFEFTLPAAEAYGVLDPDLIQEMPFHALPESERFPNKEFEPGDRLVFDMGRPQERLGTVSEVLEQSVLIDFNHALAGKDLHFQGQVLYIREPRQEEKAAERYIEPNGIRSDSRLRDD